MINVNDVPPGDLITSVRELERTAYLNRIQKYGVNPFAVFYMTYFQHKMYRRVRGQRELIFTPPAQYHLDLTQDLYDMAVRNTDTEELLGAFYRGAAKSTLGSECYPLWGLAELMMRNVVLVGASSQEKEYLTRLRNITAELENNPFGLTRDYPGLRPAKDAKQQWVRYTDSEVVLTNGGRIAAMPFGGNIRGQSYLSQRPDTIILDDPETRRTVRSKTMNADLWNWLSEDLVGAEGGEGAIIIWLGTYLGYDCLLLRASKPERLGGKGWAGPRGVPIKVPMITKDGRSAWPAMYPADRIKKLFKKHGRRAFAIERMLQVRAGEDAIYLEDWFLDNPYYPGAMVEHGPGIWEYGGVPLSIWMAVDPAISENEEGNPDNFAVAIVGIDNDQNMYLLDAIRERKNFPDQIKAVVRMARKWHPLGIGIETEAYQLALKQAILVSYSLPLIEVKRSRAANAKEERLTAFSAHVENGKLKTNLDQKEQQELVVEALEFPLGAKDDLLDAVETACELAMQGGNHGDRGDLSDEERDTEQEYMERW